SDVFDDVARRHGAAGGFELRQRASLSVAPICPQVAAKNWHRNWHRTAGRVLFTPLFTPRRFFRLQKCRNACHKGPTGKSVRLTPKSGHWNSVVECPLCAKSGHSRRTNEFGAEGLILRLSVLLRDAPNSVPRWPLAWADRAIRSSCGYQYCRARITS